ncbi:MAG TPA: SDR family NAD(P)-dependent oxidoreductase, partial [Polyangiaceae bacterium]|nr:SDR family NAD(P)-dependent oxidoreductase [Polyangiaceae bacterium]
MLITGAGRGIGAATALLAAARGYSVVVNFVSNHLAAEQVVETIRESGGEAIAVQADVSNEREVARLFETVDATLGCLTVLVNNAGVVDVKTRVEHMHEDRLRRMMGINVIGGILCAAEAVRRMSTTNGGMGGSIVNVSSAAARHGSPNEYVDYAASKAAVDAFTVGLAKEVAHEGIRVNAVRPGIIATEIHASGGEPDRAERMASSLPMRRS